MKYGTTIVTYGFYFILLYCFYDVSVANTSTLFSTFEHFCFCSRTKKLSLSFVEKQPSLFSFCHYATLLQTLDQNIIRLSASCSQAVDALTVSVYHYQKWTTDCGKRSNMTSFVSVGAALCSVLKTATRTSRYGIFLQRRHA